MAVNLCLQRCTAPPHCQAKHDWLNSRCSGTPLRIYDVARSPRFLSFFGTTILNHPPTLKNGVMECLPIAPRVPDPGDLDINRYRPATASDPAPSGSARADATSVLSRKRQQPREKAAYPRKRAVQACRTCRLRRTKCDNEHPSCTSCVNLGVECRYQVGDPST